MGRSWRLALAGGVLSLLGLVLPAPPASAEGAQGYWLVGADGGVFSFGDAVFYGSLPAAHIRPAAPVVGMAATSDGRGYWLVGADGGVFSFGDAVFYGSLPAAHIRPAAPVVGMAATSDGRGYWLVGADGGVFSFGDAIFHGSMAGTRLNAPVSGMAATPDGRGYWLVAQDGGVFALGDAGFYGSDPGGFNRHGPGPPVIAIADVGEEAGYTLADVDGWNNAYGQQNCLEEFSGYLAKPIVDLVPTPDGGGFWLFGADGGVFAFCDATYDGSLPSQGIVPNGGVVGGATP